MNGIGDYITSLKETRRLAAQVMAELKGDAPGHPFRGNQYDGGSGGASSGRKQPTISGDRDLSSRANKVIDKFPDALVPPYRTMTIEKSSGLSRTNNNKVIIGDMPGMDSDAVIEHEILHAVAPKYKVDYPKKVSDAGDSRMGESAIKYSEPSQKIAEDFVSSAHAYLSETRGFQGPTFEDAKRAGMLNDDQIAERRKYFKGLIGD